MSMAPTRLLGKDHPAWIWTKIVLVNLPITLLLVLVFNHRIEDARKAATARSQVVRNLSDARFAYSINRSVCGFRDIADDTIKRSESALHDPAAKAGTKDRNRQAIADAIRFKATQVTSPADFNCASLPKKPPRDTHP